MPLRTSLLLTIACSVAVLGLLLPSRPCHAQWQETTFRVGLLRETESGKLLLMEHRQVWETRTRQEKLVRYVREIVEKVDPVTNEKSTTFVTKPVFETRQVPVSVSTLDQRVRELEIQRRTFRNLDGTIIEAGTLSQRIKQQPVVLVTTNGRPLPKAYVPLFQADTLVIVTAPRVQLLPVNASATPTLVRPSYAPITENASPPATLQPARQTDNADAQAEPKQEWPTELPPTFRLAKLDKQNRLVLRKTETRMLSVEAHVPSENNPDDGSNWQTTNLEQRRTVSYSILIPPSLIKAQTVSGEPFNKQQQTMLQENETPVAVSTDGKPVAELWLEIIEPAGLVVQAPLRNRPSGEPNEWSSSPHREVP